jgi:hypothetical protein
VSGFNLSRRRSMEAAIAADLAFPGPISLAPECECGCGRTVDAGWFIQRGAVYREDCFQLLEDPPRCLYCGAEMKSGNFCDPDCYEKWRKT